jgi:hypothetical protein
MLALLIVIFGCGPVLFWQYLTWDAEPARLLQLKMNAKIRFQWLEDEEEGLDTYFELAYIVDPMTNSVILHITDFATPSDQESSAALWNQAISDLKRIIGA